MSGSGTCTCAWSTVQDLHCACTHVMVHVHSAQVQAYRYVLQWAEMPSCVICLQCALPISLHVHKYMYLTDTVQIHVLIHPCALWISEENQPISLRMLKLYYYTAKINLATCKQTSWKPLKLGTECPPNMCSLMRSLRIEGKLQHVQPKLLMACPCGHV